MILTGGRHVDLRRRATMVILAHFDGRVIVPDGPVDLPIGQRLALEVRHADPPAVPDRAEAIAAAERLIARAVPDLRIDRDALCREDLYGFGPHPALVGPQAPARDESTSG